jgi:hypothetical protein
MGDEAGLARQGKTGGGVHAAGEQHDGVRSGVWHGGKLAGVRVGAFSVVGRRTGHAAGLLPPPQASRLSSAPAIPGCNMR